MSPIGQKTFTVKASLFFGLAFIFMSGCGNSIPTWYRPYNSPSIVQEERKLYEPEELDTIYKSVSTSPSYPGGSSSWSQHLKKTLKYPQEAYKNGVDGTVFLSFDVKYNGEIKNVVVNRGIGYGCDEEAVRVLLSSGKWNPATYYSKAVNSASNIRIVFKLKN